MFTWDMKGAQKLLSRLRLIKISVDNIRVFVLSKKLGYPEHKSLKFSQLGVAPSTHKNNIY